MMNDTDLRNLWKGQQTPVVDLSAIHKKIKYFKLRRIGESYAIIILMILAIAFGMMIWIHWTPLLTVTKMGIILLTTGFMSLGFVLYCYEYTFYRSFYWGIIAYSILLLWITLNWFVLRRSMIKKRHRKFSDFMNLVESYKKQLLE